jgi:hypothetical protein
MSEVVTFSFLSVIFLCCVVFCWVVAFRKIQKRKDSDDKMDVVQILEENYRTMGVSDADALVNIYDDIEAGYFVSTLEEWGMTEPELYECVNILRKKMMIIEETF